MSTARENIKSIYCNCRWATSSMNSDSSCRLFMLKVNTVHIVLCSLPTNQVMLPCEHWSVYVIAWIKKQTQKVRQWAYVNRIMLNSCESLDFALRGLKSPQRHLWKGRFPWRYINCKIHFSNITQQPYRISPICKATSNKCHLLRSRLSRVIERYFITWRRRIRYNTIQVFLKASSGHITAESRIN